MITVPKLLTRPCTIRIPKFMMDCCTLVMTDRLRMVSRLALSQRQSDFSGRSCGNFFRVYSAMPMPEMNWEKVVAAAAPRTPQCSTSTHTRSSRTFSTADTARNSSGTTELPTARSRLAK